MPFEQEYAKEENKKLGRKEIGDLVIKELKAKFKDHDTAGFKVRAFRLRNDMTQSALAKTARLSQADLSKIENGKLTPGVAMAKKLAMAPGCDYHELV